MSLIRSEHINDQAVREGKDSVANAESALEDARAQLEKRERAQYHEEQIWSDTIRRNSTWVTFGLMGVNIFLLLLSLAILEPWRRRRMVREIKTALEAQNVARDAAPTLVEAAAPVAAVPVVSASPQQELPAAEKPAMVAQAIPEPTRAPVPVEAPTANAPALVETTTSITSPDPILPTTPIETPLDEPPRSTLSSWSHQVSAIASDVVSDRVISIRRIDYTTAVLQGAAAGAIMTAAVFAMLWGH